MNHLFFGGLESQGSIDDKTAKSLAALTYLKSGGKVPLREAKGYSISV